MNDLLHTLNGFTIFMLAFVVVGIPVIGGLLMETYKITLKHREKMASALNAQAAEKAAQYAAHTERLERRVRVLERIVTDRGADLSDEIDRLSDGRPSDPSLSEQRPLN